MTRKHTHKVSAHSEIEALKARLREAEETIQAIRSGEVDALVVAEPDGHKIFTLKSEDYTYRVLVEQMQEGAATFTPDGTILYANKRLARLLNIPLEKLIGFSIFSYVLKEDLKSLKALIKQELKERRGSGLEVNIQSAKGKIIPTYTSINFLQVYEVPALSIVMTDLSALKISNKLKESEERFRAMAENIPNLAWMAKTDGYIYWYNKRWYDYTGTTPREMEGWGWQSVHDQKRLPHVLKQWQESIKTGKPFEMVFPIKGADGQFRPFLTRVIPIQNEKGKIVQWFGTNTDVTELKRLERQKDDFLGIASHELKTPVTSIKAYGQVLQLMFRRKGDIKAVEQLQKMDAQINKLTNLIGDLLDVTKIQSGRLQFHEELFDFNKLVNEIVDELQITTEKHKIIKKLGKTKIIYADRERIGQVLNNLITNAIKYSPHSKKIIVKSFTHKDTITLCVEDFGVGIPKDKQNKVFEQFFRVSGSIQNTFPGLGLGLYVSSEIIKRENGRIWVESAEGKGSTFCFSLPLKKNKSRQQINKLIDEEIKHE